MSSPPSPPPVDPSPPPVDPSPPPVDPSAPPVPEPPTVADIVPPSLEIITPPPSPPLVVPSAPPVPEPPTVADIVPPSPDIITPPPDIITPPPVTPSPPPRPPVEPPPSPVDPPPSPVDPPPSPVDPPPSPVDPPPSPVDPPPSPVDPPPSPVDPPPSPVDPPPSPVDPPPSPVDPPPSPVDPPPSPADPPPSPVDPPPSPADPPPSPVDPPPPTDPSPPPPTENPPPSAASPPPKPSFSPPPPGSSPPLFNPPPSLVPSPKTYLSSPPPKSNSPPPQVKVPLVVGAAVGGAALLLAVLGLLWFLCVRKNKRRRPQEIESNYKPGASGQSGPSGSPPSGDLYPTSSGPPSLPPPQSSNPAGFSTDGSGGLWPDSSEGTASLQGMALGRGAIAFTYDELKIATNGFSNVNLLGQGGFGYVHKGMLQNGKTVAVKSLKVGSGQGLREFQAEVETISRVHHKHLVTLVGYCITDSQKLLVYEFVENKTMEFHLHGKEQPALEWPTRLKIAIGAAKGLAYLHEDCHPKIIHRDIKAANILIDRTFEAQVADFGLAKFTSDADTHVSTRVMGTFGYLAPEYAASGQLSEKSDVFSFGVLLLELITGRRPVDTSGGRMEDSLVDWARPLIPKALEDGKFDSIVDPQLDNNYDFVEMGRMISCAGSCVHHSAKRRPKMSEVVRALEGHIALSNLSDGVRPGFSSYYSSSDMDGSSTSGDTMRFRKVFGSEDGASGNFTAPLAR